MVLLLINGSGVLAVKEIGFEVTDPTRSWEIGRDKTYDYAPSVLKEDNGETKIYTCGGQMDGTGKWYDSIYLTVFNSNGIKTVNQNLVLSPLVRTTGSDDSAYACAPSVIKHSFAGLENGKEKYLMYYECAPKVYQKSVSDGLPTGIFTQTCVAFSDDGINWQKYNEDIWTSKGRLANANEPPTAVIKMNPLMAQKFGIEKIGGKWWSNLNVYDGNAYGVGHPTVLVKDGQIWLYYYDSVGEYNDRGMFLAKSDNGFNFYPPIKIANIRSPMDVRYVAVPAMGRAGFFVAFGGGYGKPYYNYSGDGITWAWNEVDSMNFYIDFLVNNYSLGQVSAGKCLLPGSNTFGSDKHGIIHSLDVDVYINEGYLGGNYGCTSTNGCTCYSSLEDGGKGYSWQTYRYKGKFIPIIPTIIPTVKPTTVPTKAAIVGDYDGDRDVDLADFGIWKGKYLG